MELRACVQLLGKERGKRTKVCGSCYIHKKWGATGFQQGVGKTQDACWHEPCSNPEQSITENDPTRGGIMTFAYISKRLTIIFMVLSFLLPCSYLLPTVNFPKAYGETNPSNPETRVFTAASDKGTAPIRAGETFHIVLEANPSTGYSWHVTGVDTSILQPGDMEFRPTSELLGAPEQQIIPFTALRAGETAIDLVYKRPWEQEMRLQNFMMNVRVTE